MLTPEGSNDPTDAVDNGDIHALGRHRTRRDSLYFLPGPHSTASEGLAGQRSATPHLCGVSSLHSPCGLLGASKKAQPRKKPAGEVIREGA